MITYRLQLIRSEAGRSQAITGQLSGGTWTKLLEFREHAARLAECEWVKAGCPGKWSLSTEIEEEDVPSDTAIAATLHLLRPFVLQSETLYFPTVTSQLYQEIDNVLARSVISTNVAMFSSKDMRAAYRITVNELELNTENTFDLWLDAFEYHPAGKRTPAKRERFIEAYGGPPDALARAVFRGMLRGKVFAVLNMADFAAAFEAC